MKHRIRCVVLSLLLVLVCSLFPLGQSYAAPLLGPDVFTPQALADVIDPFIQEHRATTAGVSITVLHNQDILYRRDYGNADLASQLPVGDNTVFEWGSVTKLLVWTSVMQLVEQGKLDLEAPISTYLPSGFLKRLVYDEPITMLNLMHHNAGWEDVLIGLFVKPDAATYTLEEALRRLEPRQSRKPGESVGYSNYGVALAGYIVERISGEPFYAYVNKQIFATLGMNYTSIHPTLEDNQWVKKQRLLSKGYAADLTPLDDLFAIPLYPAGMATGTMGDFIHFCSALLPAAGEDSPLFANRETLDLMLSPTLYYGDSGFARNNHGFWTFEYAEPMLGHSGNTAAFSAQLLVHPQSGMGFLVMTNQANESVYNSQLASRLFGSPEHDGNGQPLPDAAALRGIYQSSRIVHSGCTKLYAMMMTIPLPYATGDSLSMSIFGKNIITLRETAPSIFTSDPTGLMQLADFIYAGKTPSGRNTLQMPYMEFVQTATGDAIIAYVTLMLWVLAALYCMITVLCAFPAWIIRRIRKMPVMHCPGHRLHLFLCVAGAGAIANIMWLVMNLLAYAPEGTLMVHLAVNIAYMLSAAISGVLLLVKQRKSAPSRWQKARYCITAIATLSIIINIVYWNLCWF